MIDFRTTKSRLTIAVERSAWSVVKQNVDLSQCRGNSIRLCIHSWCSREGFQTPTIQRQLDHLLSDGIFFVALSLHDLIALYLAWLKDHKESPANDEFKPRGFLFLLSGQPLSNDLFSLHCLEHPFSRDRDILQLEQHAFERLIITPEAHSGPTSDFLRLVADASYAHRRAHGTTWSDDEVKAITASFLRHQNGRQFGDFSITDSITQEHPSLGLEGSIQSVLVVGTNKDELSSTVIPVLSIYLAFHAQTSHHWASWTSATIRCDAKFVTYHFRRRYLSGIKALFAGNFQLSDSEIGSMLDELCHIWSAILIETVTNYDKSTVMTRHLERFELHREFLHGRNFQFKCMTCLAASWVRLLACNRHGLCGACIQKVSSIPRSNCGIDLPHCRICNEHNLAPSLNIEGPAARCRVLALDGGGVGGLNQLRVLKMLEEELGEGMKLRDFFDLIVGTSVGKLSLVDSRSNV